MNSAQREEKKIQIARKKRQFVAEYLVDFDARRAAIACGLPETSGLKLIAKPDVDAMINAKVAAKRRALEIDGAMVLRELAGIAFANVGDYYHSDWVVKDSSELTDQQKRAVEAVQVEETIDEDGRTLRKVKFKLYSKVNALELLGKNLRLFQESKSPIENLVEGLADRLAAARQNVLEASK